jgi:hypothetical protein
MSGALAISECAVTDPNVCHQGAKRLTGSGALFATGLGALGLLGWRRKKAAAG